MGSFIVACAQLYNNGFDKSIAFKFVGIALFLLVVYPAFWFIKMSCCNGTRDDREEFAKAYKRYGKFSVFVSIGSVILLVIVTFALGVSITRSLFPFLICIVQLLMVAHFVKVVN